jgi:predicted metal-dependent hydrolase
MNKKIAEGVQLFNSKKYFETHEVLEEVWLKTKGEQKLFLHGLIQIAAAFHHQTRRNPAGFRSLLEKGLKKLENFAEDEEGIDLGDLRKQLQPWQDHLKATHPTSDSLFPPLPQIKKRKAALVR